MKCHEHLHTGKRASHATQFFPCLEQMSSFTLNKQQLQSEELNCWSLFPIGSLITITLVYTGREFATLCQAYDESTD
jgi:hypothetical protein